jgi:hypothetical protein
VSNSLEPTAEDASNDESRSDAGIASIGEAFFAVEAAEDLYNWRVMGVQIWPVMRSRLLKTLMANSGLFASGVGKQVDFYDDVEQQRWLAAAVLLDVIIEINLLALARGEKPGVSHEGL